MKKINKMGKLAIVYVHPWEIDPKQPRVNSLKQGHYYRLSTTERKFKKLLKDFKFTSVKEILGVDGRRSKKEEKHVLGGNRC
jgi:hypothetical protein